MGKRFAVVIGVAATGVMALGTQTAAAPSDVVKYDTKLRISADRGFLYHGWVESEVRRCERGRWVTLFKQRPGADRRLGTDRTGGPGWGREGWGSIEAHGVRGHVYAKVRPKVRDRFVCRADRAPNTGTYGSPRSRRAAGVGSAIPLAPAGVMALGAQTAAAPDVVEYDTKLTLKLHVHDRFWYWVQSEGGEVCERGRRVILFEVWPGADRRLGTARSKYRSRRGLALIRAREQRRAHTVVYAKVRREVHDEFVCGGDRSPVHDHRP